MTPRHNTEPQRLLATNAGKREWLITTFVFCVGCAVYALHALAWPLRPGRDFATYHDYFAQMWMIAPGNLEVMLARTPVVPLFFGSLNLADGALLTEIVLGIMYAGAVALVYRIGSEFNRQTGLCSVFLLLLFTPWAYLFHQVNGDGVFAFLFVVWVYAIFKTSKDPRPSHFFWHGIFVGLLVLTRPAAQVFVLFALYPFFLGGLGWRPKVLRTLLFLFTFTAVWFSYASYNYLRYDHFAIAQGRHHPFPKLFKKYRLIAPENGPASREVARLIEENLLSTGLYKRFDVTLDEVFDSGSAVIHYDIIKLVEEHAEQPRILRKAALEAILANPARYAKLMAYDVITTYSQHPDWGAAITQRDWTPFSSDADELLVRINNRIERYRPEQDEDHSLIPISLYDLKRYTSHDGLAAHFKTKRAAQRTRFETPKRRPNELVARQLQRLTDLYPGWFFAFALIAIGTLAHRDRKAVTYLFVLGLVLFNTLFSVLGVNLVWQYRVMLDPVILIGAALGIIRRGIHRQRPQGT